MQNFYLNLLFAFSFITFSISIIVHKHRSKFKHSNLPPGSSGLPYIGETLEVLSTGWKGHPQKFFLDRIDKYESQVFKTNLFCQTAVVLCGASGNKFMFSKENKVLKAWYPDFVCKIFPSSAQRSPIEQVDRLRTLLPEFLRPEALKRYVGIFDTVAGRHFESEWENKEVVVFPLAKSLTFGLACRLFLSIEDPDHIAKLASPFNLVVSGIFSIPIDLPGTPLNRAITASNFIRTELFAIIKQRKKDLAEGKAARKQDILSHMLLACDDKGAFMSELSIADTILALLASAHESTSAACAFIVKYLAELPHIYEGVYKEQMEISETKAPGDELLNWNDIQKMRYSWKVIREVLRLCPTFPNVREAIHDFDFNCFLIPKGWKVYWNANSTHRNPEYFPEPERFDPSRFEGNGPAPYTFVPFGGGPMMCPGREFARIEMLVFMHNLVKRFKFDKFVAEEKIVFNPMPIPEKGVPIRLFPHRP